MIRAALGALIALLALAAPALAEHSVTELMSVDHVADAGGDESFSFDTDGISADGSRVTWVTSRSFLPEDNDTNRDIYLSENGAVTLVTTGPLGNSPGNVPSCGVTGSVCWPHTPDLSKIIFHTSGSLVPEDTDTETDYDLYMWENGTTTLIGTGMFSHYNYWMTEDGNRIFFESNEPLAPQDTDTEIDLYERSDGTLKLVTAKSDGTNGSGTYALASADGSRVFFHSYEKLVPEDNDLNRDIYERSNGDTTLVTTSPALTTDPALRDISEDGDHVFFATNIALVPEDTDTRIDLYERTPGGAVVLVSTGPNDANQCSFHHGFLDATDDGQEAYFRTTEPLVVADTDGCEQDMYRRAGGVTSLVTTGTPEALFLNWEGQHGDGVFFWTTQALVPEDTDGQLDIYEYTAGAHVLRTPATAQAIHWQDVTPDGDTLVFATSESLKASDTDSAVDLYEVADGGYTHLTAGLAGPDPHFSFAMAAANGTVALHTKQSFGPDPDGGDIDVYRFRVASAAGYPRPKGASPFQVYLVPAYQACTSPNRTHGPPLAFGSCAPPAQGSPNVTVGTADANGQPSKSIASVRLDTLAGNPTTPADEADVQIAVTESDVRERPGLGDYTGELQLELGLRTTERDGALPSGGGPAAVTSVDAPLSVTVPCQATADTTVGASCNLTTTADSVVPGAVVERRRAIWALGQVRMFDGGPDGDVQTADNALFQVQGVFIP